MSVQMLTHQSMSFHSENIPMPTTSSLQQACLQLRQGSMHYSYTEGNQQPPIVFLHAVGNSGQSFEKLMTQLSIPSIAPDLLGFGNSSLSEQARFKSHAQAVLELMDTLNVKEFWIAGNSFGGDIALEVALRAPERVKGVISLNGGGISLKTPWFFRAMLSQPLSTILFSQLCGPFIWKSYLKELYQRKTLKTSDSLNARLAFLNEPGRMKSLRDNLKNLDTDRTALHTRLKNFSIPSLVIYGEKDPEFSLDYGKHLSQILGAAFHQVEGAGHFVHEDQPEIVKTLIQSWILQ